MMKDFFQKVVVRYGDSGFLGSQFCWISPVITGQMEYGYNFADESSGRGRLLMEGYHTKTIEGLRAWLQSPSNPDRYDNLVALNTKWGTGFANWSDVVPPKTNQGYRQATIYHYAAMFSTNAGRDFWKYMAKNLYEFANELKVITETHSSAKFVISLGGVSPNDQLVLLRCSYDVLKWGEVCDGIKTAFGVDRRNPNTAITLDYLQNYPNKKQTELQFIDYTDESNYENPDVIKPRMIESGRKAIESGAKDLMFISMAKILGYNTMMQDVCKSLVNYTAISRDTGGRAATVRLEELLSSAGQRGIDHWLGVGGGIDNRVAYTFVNSSGGGGGGGGDLPYVLALYPEIQTYYLRDLATKNSVYGRVAEDPVTHNPIYTTLQQDYNANRVPFLVPSHGITYPTGVTKTRSIIEIKDNAGVLWVRMVQDVGVNTFENGVNYSNNHVELRFTNATEDGRFWLPRSASYYEIKIQVFDAGCRFQVDHADTSAPDQYHEQIELSAGATHTFTIPSSKFNQENVNHRVIKINNNKWS